MIEIPVLSVQEAADLLNVSRDSVYDAIRRNKLRVVRLGKRLHVVQEDALAYRPRAHRRRRPEPSFWQPQTTAQLLARQRVPPFDPDRLPAAAAEGEGEWGGFDAWLQQEKEADREAQEGKERRL